VIAKNRLIMAAWGLIVAGLLVLAIIPVFQSLAILLSVSGTCYLAPLPESSEIDSRLIGRADLAGCFEQRQVATLLSWTLLSAFPGGVHDPAGIVDHLVPVQEPDVQGDQSATQCSQTLAFVISNIGQK
jgi:hypothetical protein